VALAVCRAWGPIATTSANRHGQPPATTAAEVASALGSVEVILDAGRCDGQPSTVVDATGAVPRLLRPGGVSWADLAP
jgi:tRNA A37 threonylcarbamoyladenosine synthetase subunit TsaC/SUA5/YrdC